MSPLWSGQVRAPRGSDDLVSVRDPGEYRARGALIENMMFLLQLSRINIKLRRRDNPLIKPRRLEIRGIIFYTKHKTIYTKKSHQIRDKHCVIICHETSEGT